MVADFTYEKKIFKKGFKFIAGADEVGRGSFAGPVAAAAVVFSYKELKATSYKLKGIKIDDSKKLRPREREEASAWIKKNSLTWGIGEASVSIINKLGIDRSTKIAFRRAIASCNQNLESGIWNLGEKKQRSHSKIQNSKFKIQYLLVDAFYIPFTKGLRRKNQKAIIHGDEKCFSVAAASIIAKVYRDGLMRRLAKKHKVYGWERNKGYGTKEHQEAIKRHGITRLHRKKFIPQNLI